MFNFYKFLKGVDGEEFAEKVFESVVDGKEEYHTILKTLIVLENENSEKIDHIIELFQNKKKDDLLTDEELKLVAAITAYLYKNDK